MYFVTIPSKRNNTYSITPDHRTAFHLIVSDDAIVRNVSNRKLMPQFRYFHGHWQQNWAAGTSAVAEVQHSDRQQMNPVVQCMCTCETVRICRTNVTSRPSRTSWVQNVPRKYGFIAKVMSGPINAWIDARINTQNDLWITENELNCCGMTSVFDFYMKYSIACSHLFTVYSETYQSTDWLIHSLIDWLVFNGTFSINRLYHAFDKNAADKKIELNWNKNWN